MDLPLFYVMVANNSDGKWSCFLNEKLGELRNMKEMIWHIWLNHDAIWVLLRWRRLFLQMNSKVSGLSWPKVLNPEISSKNTLAILALWSLGWALRCDCKGIQKGTCLVCSMQRQLQRSWHEFKTASKRVRKCSAISAVLRFSLAFTQFSSIMALIAPSLKCHVRGMQQDRALTYLQSMQPLL